MLRPYLPGQVWLPSCSVEAPRSRNVYIEPGGIAQRSWTLGCNYPTTTNNVSDETRYVPR